MTGRATFLIQAACCGVVAAHPLGGVAAELTGNHNIDVHQHMVPPQYIAAARASGRISDVGETPLVTGWTPQQSLDRMDALGIDTAYLSISTPGVAFGARADWKTLARSCNEYAADLRRRYPGRFGSFAVLPLPDVEASLEELAYAFDVLHADGVVLLSVYDTKWVGDAAFAPILAELERRKAIAFVHPSVGTCCRTLLPDVSFSLIEYPIDTTRAIVSLLVGGSFTRFPNVRFIFPHGGGTMPMLADRVTRQLAARHDLKFPVPPLELLKKQYYDVALSVSAPTLAATLAFADPARVLFGSDFPFVEMSYTTEGLRHANVPASVLRAIQRDNARALLSSV